MKLSTTTGISAERFGYAKAIQMIAQAGFDAYDMNMCEIHISDSELSGNNYLDCVKHLNSIALENNIVCNQAHAPFPTQLNGNGDYNEKTLAMIIRSMECAALLGAKIIVMHPIKNSSSSKAGKAGYEPFENRLKLYEANIDFFSKLVPYCHQFNIKIAVENMWERHPLHHETLIPAFLGSFEEHSKFISDINSEWLVGCLDIGHALICGQKPQDAIMHLGRKQLKALHIHDCNGYEDTHNIPYSMSADWNKILKALSDIEYDGDFTFEADNFMKKYPDELIPEALEYMCKIGRYMISRTAQS